MDSPDERGLVVPLAGWGMASADLSEVAALRRVLPGWAPADTPAHFLKHADEQTVVAVAAIDRAMAQWGLAIETVRPWPIVAAPQCIGRMAGAATLGRFARSGAPAVSPHLIPQHSLHSVSGALSILLGSRAANLGVSGGANSLEEGLLALLTLVAAWNVPGAWLVGTAMEPEPQLTDEGRCLNAPRAWAVALAIDLSAAAARCGQLMVRRACGQFSMPAIHATETDARDADLAAPPAPSRWPELARRLEQAQQSGRAPRFRWTLAAGVQVELMAVCAGQAARAAA
jgi:hypothetical protein